MENIAKAIIKVMQTVKGMEKNSRVGKGTKGAYDGTKDKDVKEIMNKALAENGLCILPIGVTAKSKVSRWTEDTNYGVKQKQSIFTEVVTKYLLLHESGESIELAGYGHGVDSQDKGAGKATTYALKNCLLYMFLTPVGKIDDTDTTHSQEQSVPQTTTKKKTPKKAAVKVAKKEIQDTDTDAVITWAQKFDKNIKGIEKHYILSLVQKALIVKGLKKQTA